MLHDSLTDRTEHGAGDARRDRATRPRPCPLSVRRAGAPISGRPCTSTASTCRRGEPSGIEATAFSNTSRRGLLDRGLLVDGRRGEVARYEEVEPGVDDLQRGAAQACLLSGPLEGTL